MRSNIILRLSVLGLAALALSACDTLKRDAGLTKQSPDEFAVVTKAPLIIPPDFNLHPPAPGAPPLNQQDPTTSAANALFNGADPQTVAQGMSGDFTPGEKMLLANAGVQNTDPSIRAELRSDAKAQTAADPSFTDRLLNGTTTPSKAAPTIQKDTGGWFDWL